MKKLKTKIEETESEVILDRGQITVDNHQLRIIEENRLGILIELDGKEMMVDDVIELPDEGIIRVEIRGYTIDVKVIDPINEALANRGGASGDVISPMSGTISNINVEIGQEVDEGQVLLIISAMKMENQITSPVAGVVKNIKVNNNDQVPSGKLLAIVEPKE